MKSEDGLDAGRAALGRGDWPAARRAFDESLQTGDHPEALEGLGLAAWWLDLADVVFDVRERAYRLYRERDDGLARRGWPSGSPGTRRRSAASRRLRTAGCNGRIGC